MIRIILLAVMLAALPAIAPAADLLQCVQACLAGSTITPTIPTTPTTPTTPTVPTTQPPQTSSTKIFPHKITFERSSDEGYGSGAVILFDDLAEADISTVTVNGEAAKKATPYRGHPVFTLSKTGDQYSRPLKFIISGSDGQVYTMSSGSATTLTTTGGKSETSKTSAWANGNRDHFRLSKTGSAYGNGITLEFSNGLRRTVTTGANRQEWSDGTLWKPVSDSNGKAVVLGPRNVHIASVTVRY